MPIGPVITRASIDNEAGELVALWDALTTRTRLYYDRVSARLGHDGLVGLGYSDADDSGAAPGEDEADSMLRMGNYFGDLAKHYAGQAPPDFNYADAFTPIRGIGRG